MKRPSALVFLLLLASLAARAVPAVPVDYSVSLRETGRHLLHVRMQLAGTSSERDIQLPVWNALYQIRDFAQYVRYVHATDTAGRALSVRKLDKTTWRISGAESGAIVDYLVYADTPGPYGLQANTQHAFFNLAQLLMYPVDAHESPMTVTFTDLPSGWKIATPLLVLNVRNGQHTFTARTYDRLVDGPVDIGTFAEADFDQDGAHYRVVVDADPADYKMDQIVAMAKKLTRSEIAWMNERPFTEYMFLYHFPRGPGSGGMEHAYATAIDVNAERLNDDPLALPGVTAHEFFHLWNVKRLRPASLEPIDYTKEQYTRSLWFSEGFTSTVGDYMLARAGYFDERSYLENLAREIRTLQLRPAHLTQSAEDSSLDTWFDKYPQYRLPERSISYYNKGEILGVLLDLAVRDATNGRKSLREVFQFMNDQYAHQGRPFPDTQGVRDATEAVTHRDFAWFFEPYVAGLEELPYDRLFATVGLRLNRKRVTIPYTGFTTVKNFDQPPVVVLIEDGSEAARSGLEQGDQIAAVNGKTLSEDLDERLSELRVGDTIRLRAVGRKGSREIKLTLGGQSQDEFSFSDVDGVTPAQRARRAAWLRGEAEP
ncbi:MAG: M61 family metallopeptidase [Candidatus Koribacter versatilis]|uniref:M61 family metallopeptidase n=1 Tax=Candidatus Korobacter versatilis TaxID=658062 RepID=A0A932EQF5_9BACT|nr:M61 family metallopeptidase [Candidatus Koribacter versatilis]